uniref:hypothetical protein n=1 Tax=Paraeggerthella sp. TaxID=2897350 RepID=UPI003A8CE3D3
TLGALGGAATIAAPSALDTLGGAAATVKKDARRRTAIDMRPPALGTALHFLLDFARNVAFFEAQALFIAFPPRAVFHYPSSQGRGF